MNKPTIYIPAAELINQNILGPTRIIGRTQVYVLNKNDARVKTMIHAFDQLLKNKTLKQRRVQMATE